MSTYQINNPEPLNKWKNTFLSFLQKCRESLGYTIEDDNVDTEVQAITWEDELDDSHTSGVTAVWFPFISGHSSFGEELQQSIINWDKSDKKPEIHYDDLDESHTSWVTAVGSPFIPGHDQFGEKTRKKIANDNANKTA